MLVGALTALAITTANATEDINSANFLLPYCKLGPTARSANVFNIIHYSRCMGMIDAIHAMFFVLDDSHKTGQISSDYKLCTAIPEGVTNEQLINVVAKYAEAHPEYTHGSFIGIAMAAIHLTWPCK
jgi:hypothetical protein